MPRPPKPFLWRDGWYTDYGGQRTLLAKGRHNRAAAQDALLRLQHQNTLLEGKTYPDLTVLQLVDLFLDAVKVEKTNHTYLDYHRWLHEFAKQHGHRKARDVTRLMAQQFKNDWASRAYRPGKVYKPKTINHALIGLKRCWNWAIDTGLLAPPNPFGKLPLLHCEGRQRLASLDEFQLLLRHAGDSAFRHVLLALRYTPARPGDVRVLTYAMIDWDKHVWVLPRHKTSRTMKKPRPRVIPMPPVVERLLRYRLQRHGGAERVFLNARGQPWCKDSLVLRMRRVRERAGIGPDDNGENLVLYSSRHTLLTEAARSGVSGPRLQLLGGWTTSAMTDKYVHLAEQDAYEAGVQAAEGLRRQRSGK